MQKILLKILFTKQFWNHEFKNHRIRHILFISFLIGYASFGLILVSSFVIIILDNIFNVANTFKFAIYSSILICCSMIYAYMNSDLEEYFSKDKFHSQIKDSDNNAKSKSSTNH